MSIIIRIMIIVKQRQRTNQCNDEQDRWKVCEAGGQMMMMLMMAMDGDDDDNNAEDGDDGG
jgi:hypothetical protein